MNETIKVETKTRQRLLAFSPRPRLSKNSSWPRRDRHLIWARDETKTLNRETDVFQDLTDR